MLRKITLVICIIIGIGAVGVIGWTIFVAFAFGVFDKTYSTSELSEIFERNKTEIYELKNYYNNIVPKGKFIEIEFEDEDIIFRLGVIDSTKYHPNNFLNWNLNVNPGRTDSIIQTIGWSKETLTEIKKKLDQADCIRIKSGEPTKIGFKRSGLGTYSFIVFDTPIPDSLQQYYEGRSILISEQLIIVYDSPI